MAPFKTFLRFSISANAIKKLCARYRLQPIFFTTYDVSSISWLQHKKVVHFSYVALKKLFNLLSLGLIAESELIFVLKKESNKKEIHRLGAVQTEKSFA